MSFKDVLLVACALAGSFADPALAQGDGHIGVYADPAGIIACTTVPVGTSAVLYVVATLNGASSSGISGAEFRIEVEEPTGWFLSYQAPGGSLPLGNPLDTSSDPNDTSGLNIAFPACISTSSVSLGQIYAYNMSGQPTLLSIKRHNRPSNAARPCALFVLCDAPFYSAVCTTPQAGDCELAKSSSLSSCDCVHVFGLNSAVSAPEAPGAPMPPEVVAMPTLLYNPEPDIIGPTSEMAAKVMSDTTWVADWSFEGGMQGWQRIDNRMLSDGSNHWYVSSEYNGLGDIAGNALVLRRTAPCWSRPGYGNSWDYSIVLKYRGSSPRIAFEYLLGSEPQFDYLHIEADSAGVSESLVDYEARPQLVASDYRTPLLLLDGYQVGQPIDIALPNFGSASATHEVYIRFTSDSECSDEDGCPIQTIAAGLVVDAIHVSGSLDYVEHFDGTINSNISTMNSAPSVFFGEWARLYAHVTENDKCTENSSASWLFTDPNRIANFPNMAFGPGGAVIHKWLDDIIVSPWVPVAFGKGLLLSLREFPGNPYQSGRIMRSYSVRGKYIASTCTSKWSNDTDRFFGTWENLSTFTWVTRLYDLSPFVATFDSVQIRFRVSDWQYIYGADRPSTINPGPGPYLDRVRLGEVTLSGPVISEGADSRSQAQDAFADEGAPRPGIICDVTARGIHWAAPFSAAIDLASNSNPNVRLADSIWVRVRDVRQAGGIRAVSFYGCIVAGPHAGKAPPPYVVAGNGFFEVSADTSRNALGALVADSYFVDLDDNYFRGGDVLHYFWFATDDDGGSTSNPPGIADPALVVGDSVASVQTGGLLEVSFLPEISWDSGYLSAIAADDHGDIQPTPGQINNSPQSNCVLYVNKVNTRRRTGAWNRTSFMYTLDKLGYSGLYDTYDVQGFGNTNNDLASRAHLSQAFGYALIVHDAGALGYGAVPDASDASVSKISQDWWYACWMDQAITTNRYGYATLWVIGNNVINTTRDTPLVAAYLGVPTSADPQFVNGTQSLSGVAGFNFKLSSTEYAHRDFATDAATVLNYCPASNTYDTYPNSAATSTVTHRFVSGPVSKNAVIMNKNDMSHWNTIMMPFSWKDLVSVQGSNADVTLAGKILSAITPGSCITGSPTGTADHDVALDSGPSSTFFTDFRNPSYGTAVFRFSLRREAEVRLVVYDVMGRRIRSLVDAPVHAGLHNVNWDGRSDVGLQVGSGVYMLKFDSAGVSATEKLVFIR